MSYKIKLEDIDISGEYKGYFWLSDKDLPTILDNSSYSFKEHENSNPFIHEAYFTDKEFSYSIKHFDSVGHIVTKYKLLDFEKFEEAKYLADPALKKGDDRITKLIFKTEWIEEKDEFCNDMEVLKPNRVAFMGFEYSEDNNNKGGKND